MCQSRCPFLAVAFAGQGKALQEGSPVVALELFLVWDGSCNFHLFCEASAAHDARRKAVDIWQTLLSSPGLRMTCQGGKGRGGGQGIHRNAACCWRVSAVLRSSSLVWRNQLGWVLCERPGGAHL